MSLTKTAFADRVLTLVHDFVPPPPSTTDNVVQHLTHTDPDGRLWTLTRTDAVDGFVEVFAKSTLNTKTKKAWLYLRSQNPSATGVQRGDWVALVYA
jgi:hypothetical protein